MWRESPCRSSSSNTNTFTQVWTRYGRWVLRPRRRYINTPSGQLTITSKGGPRSQTSGLSRLLRQIYLRIAAGPVKERENPFDSHTASIYLVTFGCSPSERGRIVPLGLLTIRRSFFSLKECFSFTNVCTFFERFIKRSFSPLQKWWSGHQADPKQ